MQSKQLLIVVGATGALALGVLAGILWPRTAQEPVTAAAPENTPRTQEEREALVLRLMAMRDDIPEEHQMGERFMDQRWGHLGGADVLKGVDINGTPFHIDPRMYVARGPGGKRLYARAISTWTTIPEENLMRRDDLERHLRVENRMVQVENFRPNLQALRRLEVNFAPVDDPEKLPDDVKPRFPGYGQ